MRQTFTLPGNVNAPSRARRAVTRAAAGKVPGDVLGRMLLMTSEIVTNAFVHGGADEDSAIDLTVEVTRLSARITVSDAGAATAPSLQRPDPEAQSGGFGLFLVDQLSDHWGVIRENGTKVYFELDLLRVWPGTTPRQRATA